MALPESIELVVVTPEGEVLHETVTEVVLPGYDGYLGVLPGHAPMIVVLATGELRWKAGGQEHLAALSGGYAELLPDRVVVLADVGELAEDIDVERAGEARDRAQARLMGQVPGRWDLQRAEAALARALNRLQVAGAAGRSTLGASGGRM